MLIRAWTFSHDFNINTDILKIFRTELTCYIQNAMNSQKGLEMHNNSVDAFYIMSSMF